MDKIIFYSGPPPGKSCKRSADATDVVAERTESVASIQQGALTASTGRGVHREGILGYAVTPPFAPVDGDVVTSLHDRVEVPAKVPAMPTLPATQAGTLAPPVPPNPETLHLLSACISNFDDEMHDEQDLVDT